MKRTCASLVRAAMLGICSIGPASAETSEGLETMWECAQADGSTVYTNKERAGCQAMTLKPLSVVPDGAPMPTIPRTMPDTLRPRDRRPSQDRPSQRPERIVPEWAEDSRRILLRL